MNAQTQSFPGANSSAASLILASFCCFQWTTQTFFIFLQRLFHLKTHIKGKNTACLSPAHVSLKEIKVTLTPKI